MSLSAEQLSERLRGVGGSDAAAAVNLSRYKSPLRLFQEKRGEIPPDDLSDNELVHFGNVLEDVVADEFTRRRGLTLRRDRRTLWHPQHDFMLAHIDRRIIGAEEGLECKTASLRMVKEWGEEETDSVPIEYLVQCAHYMAVTGFTAWHVAVLIAGNDFRMYRIERDEELIESLVAREAAFWECVKTGAPPEPTTIEDAFSMWPQDMGKSVAATPEIAADIAQLHQLKGTEKLTKSQIDETGLRIRSFMKDATTLLAGPNGKPLATWKAQVANRIDVDRLRLEQPTIAERYTKVSPSRVLRLK